MSPGAVIECVPNFSEGRNGGIIDELAQSVESVPGVLLLDRTSDHDHHRSVLTFAGSPDAVQEAAVRAVATAVARIDLRQHHGVHPRVGAADVIPFIPIANTTLEDCVEVAHRTGRAIWERCGVPVYFYEAAALRPERTRLEEVRRGGFEGILEEALTTPDRWPDVGGPNLHESAGAAIVGARRFLIAFNMNLESDDLALAKQIARRVRTSSGGFQAVKALGLSLAMRRQVQVSMNLTDFRVTSLADVFLAVRHLAREAGVQIAGSELIGLIPAEALRAVEGIDMQWEHFDSEMVLENRLASRLRAIAGKMEEEC